ncbi:MAG: hypothetical protein ABL917_04245 [Parcubacteria group bacterium]
MEPKFQTSFIPKNPGTTSSITAPKYSGSITLVPLIANIFFVLAILAYGGLFGYEKIIQAQIKDVENELQLVQATIDDATIKQLVTASDQLKSVKHLLGTHVAVTNIFTLLQSKLLPGVRFKTFEFVNNQDGSLKITADGEGQSYAIIALQSNLFRSTDYLKNQKFDSFELTEKGTVNIKFQADLDPKLLSYTRALQPTTEANTKDTTQTQAVSTTTSTQ